MRLTCPNCGAEYEVADGMVPAAGRHVQCTACHTRWFVRGAPAELASEDQILRRLEARRSRPEAAAAPAGTADPGTGAANVITLSRGTPIRSEAAPSEAASTEPVEPARRDGIGKPEPQPGVYRPAAVTSATGAPVRTAPRLDLDTVRATPEARLPSRSRFARGLLLVLVPFLLATGAYRFADRIANRVPAAAPALDAYEALVDDLRADLERQIADFRPPPEPG
jgi:predicted Zn finger-like uncharacterized protein